MRRLAPLCCLVLPALVGALALAGCGGSGAAKTPAPAAAKPAPKPPSAEAKAAVAKAAAKTGATTADVHVAVILRKPGVANASAYQADGSVSPAGGRLVIDRSSLGGDRQTEIFLRRDGHLVVYSSPVAASLPKGKTWLKVDMTRFGQKRYGAETTWLAGADQDPFGALRLLGSPVASVRELGPDWLPDRTLNTRYEGKVSIQAAAKAAGMNAKGLRQLAEDYGTPTQTIDVWVSDTGEVRRVTVVTPAKAPDGTVVDVKTITDFSNFGTSVTVTPPPAKRVADYFQLKAR